MRCRVRHKLVKVKRLVDLCQVIVKQVVSGKFAQPGKLCLDILPMYLKMR